MMQWISRLLWRFGRVGRLEKQIERLLTANAKLYAKMNEAWAELANRIEFDANRTSAFAERLEEVKQKCESDVSYVHSEIAGVDRREKDKSKYLQTQMDAKSVRFGLVEDRLRSLEGSESVHREHLIKLMRNEKNVAAKKARTVTKKKVTRKK